jgi:hypothetical protein
MRNLTLDVKTGAIKVYSLEAHQLARILGTDPNVIKRVTPMDSDIFQIEVVGDVIKASRVDKMPFEPAMAAELMVMGWIIGNFE